MHLRSVALAAALALLGVPQTAAGPRLTAQEKSGLQSIRGLEHPTAPGALRGATILLMRDGQNDGVDRFVNYLARLLERAGAGVAVVATDADRNRAEEMCRTTGAALCLLVTSPLASDQETALMVETGGLPGAEVAPTTQLAKKLAVALERRGFGIIGDLETVPEPAETQVGRPSPSLWVEPVFGDGPMAHREATHAAFDAIVEWWSEERDAIRAAVSKPEPLPAVGERVDPLWPLDEPPRTDAEMAAFLQNWRRGGLVDSSQVWLDVQLTRADDGWQLSGSTELALLESALRRALRGLGIPEVAGSLRLLPDAQRLGGDRFAVVQARAVQTWSRAGSSTGLRAVDGGGQYEMTELLEGEPVWLLDRDGEHTLVHAASGYVGWVATDALKTVEESAFRSVRDAGSKQASGLASARQAVARLGTPYLFGGRGAAGIDCSGLVSTAWADHGVFLPRDARQQILAGKLVSTARVLEPMQPGDLLFFANSSGRISHVGMSLGGLKFVHATPPEVTIGSLDPDDPDYTKTAERFVLAKRPGR